MKKPKTFGKLMTFILERFYGGDEESLRVAPFTRAQLTQLVRFDQRIFGENERYGPKLIPLWEKDPLALTGFWHRNELIGYMDVFGLSHGDYVDGLPGKLIQLPPPPLEAIVPTGDWGRVSIHDLYLDALAIKKRHRLALAYLIGKTVEHYVRLAQEHQFDDVKVRRMATVAVSKSGKRIAEHLDFSRLSEFHQPGLDRWLYVYDCEGHSVFSALREVFARFGLRAGYVAGRIGAEEALVEAGQEVIRSGVSLGAT